MKPLIFTLFFALPFALKGQHFILEEPGRYGAPKSIMFKEPKQPYKASAAIVPAAFAFKAGLCPDTQGGKYLQQGLLTVTVFSIGYGEKKPVGHYLITTGVCAASFLAGRGVREIAY